MILSIRPEQLRIVNGEPNPAVNRLIGKVLDTTFLGEASEHSLQVNGQTLRVISTPPVFDAAAEMAVEVDPAEVVVLRE